LQATNLVNPAYFHKVVDCQWACPAHTPVPEYIRLIGQGRYSDAYMINWVSNVFPGILGRTCDRPCEPACRRGRVEENNGVKPEPVAICRLKRVAADNKGDVKARMPKVQPSNGRRIACVGAGPASLTVARDLAPLGYQVTVFEGEAKAGGFVRTQIPRFRLPESVIDEETGYIFDLGVQFRSGQRIESMKDLLTQGYDAVFVGCGAPRGRDLDAPGRKEAKANIHIGIDWLASVSFGHITSVGSRVIVLGGGNTAMDCCRSARRLGGSDVKVIVRSGFEEMKASPWEKEDAMHEGIPILNYHVPKSFEHQDGKLTGMTFQIVSAVYDEKGRRSLVPTGAPDVLFETRCWLLSGKRTRSIGLSATVASNLTVGACRCWGKTRSSRVCPQCSLAATRRMDPKILLRQSLMGTKPLCRLIASSTENRLRCVQHHGLT
jgi:formate dehydrogenase beta subunit